VSYACPLDSEPAPDADTILQNAASILGVDSLSIDLPENFTYYESLYMITTPESDN